MKTTMRILMIMAMGLLLVQCTKDPVVPEVKAFGWLASAPTTKKSVQSKAAAENDTLMLYYNAGIVDSVNLGNRSLTLNWDEQKRFTSFNAGDSVILELEYINDDTVSFKRTHTNYTGKQDPTVYEYWIIGDSVYIQKDPGVRRQAYVFDPDFRYDRSYWYWGTDSARIHLNVDYTYSEVDHPFSGLLTWLVAEQIFMVLQYPYFTITNKIIDYVEVTIYDYSTDPPTTTTDGYAWDIEMEGDRVVRVWNGSNNFDIIYK
jgi:hypothetical protein